VAGVSAGYSSRPASLPARRHLERFAIEASAAIRNEARGQRIAAAFYWRRAKRFTADAVIQRWCLDRAKVGTSHGKSGTDVPGVS